MPTTPIFTVRESPEQEAAAAAGALRERGWASSSPLRASPLIPSQVFTGTGHTLPVLNDASIPQTDVQIQGLPYQPHARQQSLYYILEDLYAHRHVYMHVLLFFTLLGPNT